MNCPHCVTPLDVSERQGVEIDICPRCRGVWLDRGELDKIIQRYDAYDDESDRATYRRNHHAKRKSFWHEMFD